MPITSTTPEDPQERRLTLKELREALAAKLPERPDHKTIYRWLALPDPLPCKRNPGGRGRLFLLSHVLSWLDDPAAYWGHNKKRTA